MKEIIVFKTQIIQYNRKNFIHKTNRRKANYLAHLFALLILPLPS